MPLPPLDDNATARAWLKYSWNGIEHEMCFRLPGSAPTADMIDQANAFATALKPNILTTDSFSALRYSPLGSTLSFPLAFTPQAGTLSATPPKTDSAQFVALAGRSAGGYRCRITFFSNYWIETDDFRLPTSAANAPAALWTAVQAASPALVAKDGLGVVWNGYVNVGYNSYWQRQLR